MSKRCVGRSEDGKIEFWERGGEIYRVSLPYVFDIYGFPMGSRWECSRPHFDRYRAIGYGWITEAA